MNNMLRSGLENLIQTGRSIGKSLLTVIAAAALPFIFNLKAMAEEYFTGYVILNCNVDCLGWNDSFGAGHQIGGKPGIEDDIVFNPPQLPGDIYIKSTTFIYGLEIWGQVFPPLQRGETGSVSCSHAIVLSHGAVLEIPSGCHYSTWGSSSGYEGCTVSISEDSGTLTPGTYYGPAEISIASSSATITTPSVPAPEPNEPEPEPEPTPTPKPILEHILQIENNVDSFTDPNQNGILQIVLKKDPSVYENLDASDALYAKPDISRSSKIVSVLYNETTESLFELVDDFRPLNTNQDLYLETALVSKTGTPLIIRTPLTHTLKISMPNADKKGNFRNKPITLQQYNPEDSSQEFPPYDLRQIITIKQGKIILENLIGSYDSEVPNAYYVLSFNRNIADINKDEAVNENDLALLQERLGQTGGSFADIASTEGAGIPDYVVDEIDEAAMLQEIENAKKTIEDFETGDFSELPWTHNRSYARWFVTSDDPYSGNYCAQSGAISESQKSAISTTLNCNPGEVSFWLKVSSEKNRDFLKFYIDGIEQARYSGQQAWTQAVFPVNQGERNFKWEYAKDYSVSEGNDSAGIDCIIFPKEVSVINPTPDPNSNSPLHSPQKFHYLLPQIRRFMNLRKIKLKINLH